MSEYLRATQVTLHFRPSHHMGGTIGARACRLAGDICHLCATHLSERLWRGSTRAKAWVYIDDILILATRCKALRGVIQRITCVLQDF